MIFILRSTVTLPLLLVCFNVYTYSILLLYFSHNLYNIWLWDANSWKCLALQCSSSIRLIHVLLHVQPFNWQYFPFLQISQKRLIYPSRWAPIYYSYYVLLSIMLLSRHVALQCSRLLSWMILLTFRGSHCKHLQCFDAEAYILMNIHHKWG